MGRKNLMTIRGCRVTVVAKGAHMDDYSAKAVGEFMDWAIDKGLMKGETGKSRKIAALKVLGALDESEVTDLRKVDCDAAFERFVNKNGRDFTPQSLAAYRGRFKSAVEDFLRYKENPAGFRFETAQRKNRVGDVGSNGADKKSSRRPVPRAAERPASAVLQPPPLPAPAIGQFTFPVPIRQNLVVEIHNIPHDLTKAEAHKIASVITALAVDAVGGHK
jgi:hypothetical protein